MFAFDAEVAELEVLQHRELPAGYLEAVRQTHSAPEVEAGQVELRLQPLERDPFGATSGDTQRAVAWMRRSGGSEGFAQEATDA